MIPAPYLLYLGGETDALSVKTSRGLAQWRPDSCVGQYRTHSGAISLGLPDLTFAEAVRRGARTLVLGIANAGGVMSPALVTDAIAAVEAGLNLASAYTLDCGINPRSSRLLRSTGASCSMCETRLRYCR